MSEQTIYPYGLDLPNVDSLPADDIEPWRIAAWYHQRSKHHFSRYARSKGQMDWANQPVAFRWYDDAVQFPLSIPTIDTTPNYTALFTTETPAQPLTPQTLSHFFYYSLAVSAWKSYGGNAWALRCNPSSGNLHPTEAYALLPALSPLTTTAGLFHYRPDTHALEQRLTLADKADQQLTATTGFHLILTSIHWREIWKYGERAFRYCQHDVGHAIAALRFAAATLGWHLNIRNDVDDLTLQRLLGAQETAYSEHETEAPDLILTVSTGDQNHPIPPLNQSVWDHLHDDAWRGRPNRLSREHDTWQAIETIHRHCQQTRPIATEAPHTPSAQTPLAQSEYSSGHIIRTRRSAQAMDGVSTLPVAALYRMLTRTVPTLTTAPWDALPWSALVHLALFVHRVDGLTPGLYLLVRNNAAIDPLQQAMQPDFLWRKPEDCPRGLDLFLLQRGDARQVAAQVSCSQEIAGDSAFSLGMLAHFLPTLKNRGACWYRRLFWETGMIGQVLYLEAQDYDVQGTGIGCFFDDPVHQLLGLTNMDWQSLYHFTVGGAIIDPRLITKPAYPHA